MSKTQTLVRPTFDEASRTWKNLLNERKLPSQLIWVFGDNLYFEEAASAPGGFRLGFQTTFTPPPPDAEAIAYRYFVNFEAPIVFYRLGTHRDKSVCLLLCDEWFQPKTDADGFLHKSEWGIAFKPGKAEEIEEITDAERWKNRWMRERPLHDLDFCMDLRAVHEILAHGRVLSTYEHYALKLLHVWRRIFEERGQFHQ